MSSDPAFLFYPGDYLRDTQNLSEPAQVAYDRIMCEHMRKICISQQRLNFFTKRLSPEHVEELLSVLEKTDEGYIINWVRESILKRRNYSESRSKNRKGKGKNISNSYDNHMENENENVIENRITNLDGGMGEDDLFKELSSSHSWLEGVAKNVGAKSVEEITIMLKHFLNTESLVGSLEKRNMSEIKSHFLNWSRKYISKNKQTYSDGGQNWFKISED